MLTTFPTKPLDKVNKNIEQDMDIEEGELEDLEENTSVNIPNKSPPKGATSKRASGKKSNDILHITYGICAISSRSCKFIP